MKPANAWWPLTRKVRQALAAYITLEAAAVAGEVTTGVPGWAAILGGAIVGAGALLTAYWVRDETSPAP